MLNLNIKINGLNDNTSLKVVDAITDIIEQFSYLDFRRFENIIITSHFQRDIESLTSSNKSVFKNMYIASNDTLAVVLTVPKNDDFELVLVIKSNFITNIIKDPEEQGYKDALHILHHELAHIHDNNKKIDIFKDLMKTSSYHGIDSIIYPIAEECWSEYIANYISASSAVETDFPHQMAKTLISKINETSFNIKTQLLAFKINKQRTDLLFISIEQVKSLIKTAAYLQGYLHGFGMTLEELDYDADYDLECSYFKDIWEAMQFELHSIKQIYPDGIININIYKNLASYIEGFYNQMGIVFVKENSGEIQIHLM